MVIHSVKGVARLNSEGYASLSSEHEPGFGFGCWQKGRSGTQPLAFGGPNLSRLGKHTLKNRHNNPHAELGQPIGFKPTAANG